MSAGDDEGEEDFASVMPSDMAEYAAFGVVNTTSNATTGKKVVMKCTMLTEGTSIRVAPMEKSRGGWDDEHFHEHLRLPEGSNVGKGMVVMLEGESSSSLCGVWFVLS